MIFRKKDVLFSLIIGEAISWFLFVIARSLNQKIPYLWLLPVILPFLTLFGLYVAYLINQKIPVAYQIAKFALVGFSNAAIDFAVINLLMWQTEINKGLMIILFNTIAFCVAVVNSYLWNKLWTFQSEDKTESKNVQSEFIQFIVIALVGVAINNSIVYGVSTFVSSTLAPQLWVNVAKVFATFASMTWDFLGYKFIVFKK